MHQQKALPDRGRDRPSNLQIGDGSNGKQPSPNQPPLQLVAKTARTDSVYTQPITMSTGLMTAAQFTERTANGLH